MRNTSKSPVFNLYHEDTRRPCPGLQNNNMFWEQGLGCLLTSRVRTAQPVYSFTQLVVALTELLVCLLNPARRQVAVRDEVQGEMHPRAQQAPPRDPNTLILKSTPYTLQNQSS